MSSYNIATGDGTGQIVINPFMKIMHVPCCQFLIAPLFWSCRKFILEEKMVPNGCRIWKPCHYQRPQIPALLIETIEFIKKRNAVFQYSLYSEVNTTKRVDKIKIRILKKDLEISSIFWQRALNFI